MKVIAPSGDRLSPQRKFLADFSGGNTPWPRVASTATLSPIVKSNFQAVSAALAILWLSQTFVTAATVITDQIDYQPETTAAINSSDFLPGETVELQALNSTTLSDVGAEHEPWTVGADTNVIFKRHGIHQSLNLDDGGYAVRRHQELRLRTRTFQPGYP